MDPLDGWDVGEEEATDDWDLDMDPPTGSQPGAVPANILGRFSAPVKPHSSLRQATPGHLFISETYFAVPVLCAIRPSHSIPPEWGGGSCTLSFIVRQRNNKIPNPFTFCYTWGWFHMQEPPTLF